MLSIDTSRLGHPVRDEGAADDERFPHIYGPIEREAVVAVQPLTRDANGHWVFPAASV